MPTLEVIRHRFLRYLIVGAGAVGLNLVLFASLVGGLGVQYLWATVVVFILGNAYGFAANRGWVYRVADHPGRRLARYYATVGVSLALNLLSMAFLVDGLKLSYLTASVITSAWLAPVLYLTHARVAFAQKQTQGHTRVLLVTHFYPPHGGGVEIVAGQLASRVSMATDVIWFAAAPPGDAGVDGVALRPMQCWNGLERRFGLPVPIPSPLAVLRLLGAVRASDIVWVHDLIYPANLAAAVTAMATGKPLVVTVHVGAIPYRSGVERRLMAGALAVVGRLVLTRAAAVVFVSERVRAEFLARWALRRETLVPNGVDFETFRPLARSDRQRVRDELGIGGQPMVLFVGRFVDRKGLPLLHDLAREMTEVDWVFAGRGPLDPESWHLPNVRVERQRTGRSVAELYAAADILVLPSVGEGFPLVVAEALASGLPVLVDPSTTAGYSAVASVAASEPTLGADAARRWARRIEEVIRGDTSASALARVEFARLHWDWDRAAAAYLRLFGDMVDSHMPGEPVAPQGRA